MLAGRLRLAAGLQPGVAAAERRVAGEGQLAAGREDAHAVVGASARSAAAGRWSPTGWSSARSAASRRRRGRCRRAPRRAGCRSRASAVKTSTCLKGRDFMGVIRGRGRARRARRRGCAGRRTSVRRSARPAACIRSAGRPNQRCASQPTGMSAMVKLSPQHEGRIGEVRVEQREQRLGGAHRVRDHRRRRARPAACGSIARRRRRSTGLSVVCCQSIQRSASKRAAQRLGIELARRVLGAQVAHDHVRLPQRDALGALAVVDGRHQRVRVERAGIRASAPRRTCRRPRCAGSRARVPARTRPPCAR